ncbi:MAG: heme o synthase [Polyangiales bacterium]
MALTKPRILVMVLLTAAVGVALAPTAVGWGRLVHILVGIAALVAAANTLNCWLERDVDGLMARTAHRPLPAGRMAPRVALGMGLVLSAIAVAWLTLALNTLTGVLGAFALMTYVVLYTPMKMRSPMALWVGAVPGAMPPLLGVTAAHGQLTPMALCLFALMFCWQIPHFIAIAIFRAEDYRRAGMPVPNLAWGRRLAKVQALLYALVLIPLSLWPVAFGAARGFYGLCALLLSLAFSAVAALGFRGQDDARWARQLFFASLLYLPLILGLLVLDAR